MNRHSLSVSRLRGNAKRACPIRRCIFRRVTTLLLLLASSVSTQAATITSTWTGGNSNWSTAGNWSPSANFPNNGNGGAGVTYDAILNNGGTINLDENITIQK